MTTPRLLVLLPASLALAAPKPPPTEEIIVYADDFARWDRTRWWLQAELLLPMGVELAADRNIAFRTHALQVRAVIGCDKDARLSARKWEVSCEIEDVGLLVTTANDWASEAARTRVQQVLDEVDAKLNGARVQMQVDEEGGIVNYDLEGLTADDQRQRQQQESLRNLASMVMAGFHLRIPDHGQRDGQWLENHTELMDIPSLTAARASTQVVHQASPHGDDHRIVQTVGRGMVAIAVPYIGSEPFHQSKLIDSGGNQISGVVGTMAPAGSGIGAIGPKISFPPPPDKPPTESQLGFAPSAGQQVETALEATWETALSSVAVFQRSTGIMTERTWICTGTPTAGSAGGAGTGPYLNVGRLWMLGTEDKPDVGPTAQVAWPGREDQMPDLPPWVPLER